MKRMQRLYDDEVVTLESLQNTETAFDMAKSDLDIAKFNQRYAVITAPTDGQILRLISEQNEIVEAGILF